MMVPWGMILCNAVLLLLFDVVSLNGDRWTDRQSKSDGSIASTPVSNSKTKCRNISSSMSSPPHNSSKHKYPPVKPHPTVHDCLRSLRTSDYLQWGGFTVASWGYGFWVGRPARFGMAGLMAAVGFTFGSMVAVQNTRGRLMGFRENGREAKKKYGEQVLLKSDLDATATAAPGELVRPKMEWRQFN